MIWLVVAVGDNEHGATGAHGLAGCADTTLVHNHAGSWEDSGVRGIRNSDYTRRQRALRLIPRIASNQEHCSASEPAGGISAPLKEVTGYAHCR